MLNFTQITEKASSKGFRKGTSCRSFFDENGKLMKVYDFEHRKKLDMFSVYVDEFNAVQYAELTKVSFNPATGKYTQDITKLNNTKDLLRFFA